MAGYYGSLFKGENSDGVWIYGTHCRIVIDGVENNYIFPLRPDLSSIYKYIVKKETVHQFTDLVDYDGNGIYCDDTLTDANGNSYTVMYFDGGFKIKVNDFPISLNAKLIEKHKLKVFKICGI